jgi:hypothetical protein
MRIDIPPHKRPRKKQTRHVPNPDYLHIPPHARGEGIGVLESKWDLIRQNLVRRLLEEQDKVLRSYFAQKGGARSQRGEGIQGKGREHVKWDIYA